MGHNRGTAERANPTKMAGLMTRCGPVPGAGGEALERALKPLTRSPRGCHHLRLPLGTLNEVLRSSARGHQAKGKSRSAGCSRPFSRDIMPIRLNLSEKLEESS